MQVLERLEDRIRSIARRYGEGIGEIDYLTKVGRIGAWRELEHDQDISVFFLLNAAEKAISERKLRGIDIEGGEIDFQEFFEGGDPVSSLKNKFGAAYLKRIHADKSSIPPSIVRGLVEHVWNLSIEDIPREINYQKFVDFGMQSFLWAFYRNSPIAAINDAYPGIFFEWEFRRVPNRFWQGEQGYKNALEAVKWICRKYHFDGKGKVPIGDTEFKREGLGAMSSIHFNHSPFFALRAIFPDIKEWDMVQIPKGFYDNPENHRIALEALLQDLRMPSFSQLSPEEIYDYNPRQIRKRHFTQKGLRGLLNRHNNSVHDIFNFVYPGKVHPWFFYGTKRGFENPKETTARAIRWLFDDYLKIPEQEIPLYASQELFWRVGFSGILTRRNIGLNSSIYGAVELAYPGRFSRSQFTNYKKGKKRIKGLRDFRGRYRELREDAVSKIS